MRKCKQCGAEYSLWQSEMGAGLCNPCLNKRNAVRTAAFEKKIKARLDAAAAKANSPPSDRSARLRRWLYWGLRVVGVISLLFWASMMTGRPGYMSDYQWDQHRLLSIRMIVFTFLFFPFFGGFSATQYATKTQTRVNHIVGLVSFWIGMLYLMTTSMMFNR